MNTLTKRSLRAAICLLTIFTTWSLLAQQTKSPAPAAAATSTAPTAIQKSVEAYLRNLYAFGPDVQVTVGPLKESSVPGLLATDITVKLEDNVQAVQFYVSKDGKYLLRGELSDLTKDPMA
ncbi:MAG: hypothetical protein QOJ41_86, partial [Acidobacteriaceae bacterium]|nr:hypothetical protein [Acidobacteriaceae bacterium]